MPGVVIEEHGTAHVSWLILPRSPHRSSEGLEVRGSQLESITGVGIAWILFRFTGVHRLSGHEDRNAGVGVDNVQEGKFTRRGWAGVKLGLVKECSSERVLCPHQYSIHV